MTLDKARPDDFDAALLPGGALNADHLRVDKNAQEFVRRIDLAGKPLAVICHGPWLLISANCVKSRTLTSYHPTIQDDIQNAGGKWGNEAVVKDRNWISRQPSDIPAFNREMIKLFSEYAATTRRAA